MQVNSVEELRASVGRELSQFVLVRSVRYFQERGDDGYWETHVDLVLQTESEPQLTMSLRALGVRAFRLSFSGRPAKVTGFGVESLRERQLEGLNWRIRDYEDDAIDLQCRILEVQVN